jgi:uncharacterized alkaline shock family protein YloU
VAETDPADRGTLDVRERAVQHIVVAATLQTAGVHRHGSGLGKLAGRELPRASVEVAGNHVRAAVDIAVEWGRPLPAVAAEASHQVHDALSAQSGLIVDRVTVHVATVIAPDGAGSSRKVVA